jgi:hypothetical protein
LRAEDGAEFFAVVEIFPGDSGGDLVVEDSIGGSDGDAEEEEEVLAPAGGLGAFLDVIPDRKCDEDGEADGDAEGGVVHCRSDPKNSITVSGRAASMPPELLIAKLTIAR